MTIHAVFIDTVSIQRYVFGSNKLKENIGASHLIEEVYKSFLQETVRNIFSNSEYDDTFMQWEENPDEYLIKKEEIKFEVGYIGGGNALLFFKDEVKLKTFVKEWTRSLLVKTPGIVTTVAFGAFNLNNFQTEIDTLFRKLQENKRRLIPQMVIPRHGITAECSHTGFSMDVWNDKEPEDKQDYVSSVAYAKIVASKYATDKLEKKYTTILGESYRFTDQLDELGQRKGEDSHIAIVHIDGNSMGDRFRGAQTLKAIRELSKTIRNATEESFRKLLYEITSGFNDIQDTLGYDTDDKKKKYPAVKGKANLPIRPIIIGGDDITFVCEGRLGVYFAKLFLKFFEEQDVSDGKKIFSSAGIAVTKTKYPFYRGYELAEVLCKNAKKRRREVPERHAVDGSWIDFYIAYGGFSGTLSEIRSSHYRVVQGNLNFGPYMLGKHHEYGFDTLIDNIKEFKKVFPKSKIKELRQVLTQGKEATETFVHEMKARGRTLPEINGCSYSVSLFENSKTPYFDMIELMEYYPEFELEARQGGKTE
ncbi:MAG: hypothetical protein E3K37_03465 [Candidatus Kuenenia sp.]|nr:hypothetical protein [Candidatus Kuenenia hertensis]